MEYLFEGSWGKLAAGAAGGIIVFLLNHFTSKYREIKRLNYIRQSLIETFQISLDYIEENLNILKEIVESDNFRNDEYIESGVTNNSLFFKENILLKFDSIDIIKILKDTDFHYTGLYNQYLVLQMLEEINFFEEYVKYYKIIHPYVESFKVTPNDVDCQYINKFKHPFINNFESYKKAYNETQIILNSLILELNKKNIEFD